MAEQHPPLNKFDFYLKDDDWTGRIVENSYETVHYQKNSTIRIWYNEQPHSFDAHWHNALEIIMPVENHYDIEACGQRYHVQPDEILFIPAGEMHTLYAPEKGTRFIFQFDVSVISRINGYNTMQSLMAACLHITKFSHPHIYNTVRQLLFQMRDEYFSSDDFRELSIYSYLTKLLVAIGRDLLHDTVMFSNARIGKQREYIQRFKNVISYIDDHYTQNLSLEAIAAYSGFSKYHFSRLFKQYTNYTYYEYLIFRRIKAAEELLTQPGLSVTEIALQSGFSSISSFNRIFKQKKGCTPSEYRTFYTAY
ncbi:MAG: AraC family transcriptional regulator [Lachnospiraceae bacterium]|nr:AraC family transcriptional regulator [Lachnospiraceae bacterium]